MRIILEHVIGSDLDSSGLSAKCEELTLLGIFSVPSSVSLQLTNFGCNFTVCSSLLYVEMTKLKVKLCRFITYLKCAHSAFRRPVKHSFIKPPLFFA